MARQSTLTRAVIRHTLLGLLVLLIALPVLAQDQTISTAADKFARIQASNDSLGFGSTAADSLKETPPAVEGVKGLMGLVDRSPLGQTGAGKLFVAGGMFMWWILVVAIVSFVVIIERLWTLNRARVNTRRLLGTVITTLRNDGVQAAAEECQKVRGPIAAILYSGLQKADHGRDAVEKSISMSGTIEMSFLERGLIWVSSVSTLAPLLGFLGTVYGMINAFKAIAASERVSAKVVASGISEALITTAAGLIVAVLATVAYNYFVTAIDRFVIEMEETSSELIAELERRNA
jgi:biopolymer transport protein ExbB